MTTRAQQSPIPAHEHAAAARFLKSRTESMG